MKVVKFFTIKDDAEVEVARVWAEEGDLQGTGNEVWLNDLKGWFEGSGESIEEFLEGLHRRFDGGFFYAGRYLEENGEERHHGSI